MGSDDLVALSAIEGDDLDPTRQYIPLPGGWEVQTRGSGSSYRLLDRKTGERRPILGSDPDFVQAFVTCMALEVHAAVSAALASRDKEIERLTEGKAAAATEIVRLVKERDEALANHQWAQARLDHAEALAATATRERDEARAEVEYWKSLGLRIEQWWIERGMLVFDGAPACIFQLRDRLSFTRRASTPKEQKMASPDAIAAAWATWNIRHGGKLGPGPAFSEAIAAALAVDGKALESAGLLAGLREAIAILDAMPRPIAHGRWGAYADTPNVNEGVQAIRARIAALEEEAGR